MTSLGDMLEEDDAKALAEYKKSQAEFDALPEDEKAAIWKKRADRVARDMEPHRIDWSDDED